MQTSFLSHWRWRIVGWITALIFGLLFLYGVVQLSQVVPGGAV